MFPSGKLISIWKDTNINNSGDIKLLKGASFDAPFLNYFKDSINLTIVSS